MQKGQSRCYCSFLFLAVVLLARLVVLCVLCYDVFFVDTAVAFFLYYFSLCASYCACSFCCCSFVAAVSLFSLLLFVCCTVCLFCLFLFVFCFVMFALFCVLCLICFVGLVFVYLFFFNACLGMCVLLFVLL